MFCFAVITKVEKRVNTVEGGNTGSVRNLRIREDTAKYLLNLDVNSAHYDPKSRSMREDPNPDKPLSEKVTIAASCFGPCFGGLVSCVCKALGSGGRAAVVESACCALGPQEPIHARRSQPRQAAVGKVEMVMSGLLAHLPSRAPACCRASLRATIGRPCGLGRSHPAFSRLSNHMVPYCFSQTCAGDNFVRQSGNYAAWNALHPLPSQLSKSRQPSCSAQTFAGDNFVRQSGDYAAWNALNLYSTQAAERGAELHMVAVPSAAEQLHAQVRWHFQCRTQS